MKRIYNVSLRDMECRPAKQPKLSNDENKEDIKIGDGQKCPSKSLLTGGKMGDIYETKKNPV